jgi:ribosome-associated translation inhibitor RaiA
MELVMHAKGLRLTATMYARIERRVRFAFDRFADRLVRVGVRFTDVNGPRGGEDKVCTVAVTVRGLPTVRVSQRSADMRAALDLAVQRAARCVAKAVARERETLVELLALVAHPSWAPVRRRAVGRPQRRRRRAA